MKHFRPLDEKEQIVIRKAQEAINGIKSIPCTACHYCTDGCPKHIPIPEIFAARTKQLVWGKIEEGKQDYADVVGRDRGEADAGSVGSASGCIACGQCDRACPQQLTVVKYLAECVQAFGR